MPRRLALALGLAPFCLLAEAPLPSPQALLARMELAAKASQEVHESLLYRSIETERKLDGSGQAQRSTSREREIVTVKGRRIGRLLAEDGKPLPTERAAQEEARVQAALRKALGEENAAPSKPDSEIRISSADLVAVLDIQVERREQVENRDCLRVSFRPRKEARPKGMGQRFAAKLEGWLQVDEASAQVIHAEGRLTESFWVGGGLLGSVTPPTTFELDQAPVLDGIWMPTRSRLRLQARAVFVPIRMEFETRFEGFSRFETGTPELKRVAGAP